jgi:hypothetical protein
MSLAANSLFRKYRAEAADDRKEHARSDDALSPAPPTQDPAQKPNSREVIEEHRGCEGQAKDDEGPLDLDVGLEFNENGLGPPNSLGTGNSEPLAMVVDESPLAAQRSTAPSVDAELIDWEQVNDARRQMLHHVSPSPDAIQPVTFKEAVEKLRADVDSWVPYKKTLKRVSDHVKTSGFWGAIWSCFHHDVVEGSDDYEDRDFVLSLQFLGLDHSNALHRRMLLTVYRRLVHPPRGAPDPSTRGPVWEKLGFQGSDPATDLRSTGILGVLQILYLIDFYPTFAGLLFKLSTNPTTEFPFVLVCFNFSSIAMEALKSRSLHDDIHNRRLRCSRHDMANASASPADGSHPPVSNCSGDIASDYLYKPTPVIHSVCEFYAGSMFQFYAEWRKVPSRSARDFGPIKAKLRPYVKAHVNECFEVCEFARNRKMLTSLEQNAVRAAIASAGATEFMEF